MDSILKSSVLPDILACKPKRKSSVEREMILALTPPHKDDKGVTYFANVALGLSPTRARQMVNGIMDKAAGTAWYIVENVGKSACRVWRVNKDDYTART